MIRYPIRPDSTRPDPIRYDPTLDDSITDSARPDTTLNPKWPDTRWPDTWPDTIRNLKWLKTRWADTRLDPDLIWPENQNDPTLDYPIPDKIWSKIRNDPTQPDSSISRSLPTRYFYLLMIICDAYFALSDNLVLGHFDFRVISGRGRVGYRLILF
jgi:hypothetical protein